MNAVARAKQAIPEYKTGTLERPSAEIFAAALMEPVARDSQLTLAAHRRKERFLQR